MRYHCNNVVQRQQAIALDFRVYIFTHRTTGQQLDQFDVIHQRTRIDQITTAVVSHQLNKVVERRFVVVEHQHILAGIDQLLHDHILALADELILRFDDRLQKLEILYMATVNLDAVDKVLHHLITNFVAQVEIVLEDGADGFRFLDLRLRKRQDVSDDINVKHKRDTYTRVQE